MREALSHLTRRATLMGTLALALSGARWNLVLDADEWLAADAGGARLLAQACAGEPLIGLLPVRLAFDLAGRTLAATTWRARLLPGDAGRGRGTGRGEHDER